MKNILTNPQISCKLIAVNQKHFTGDVNGKGFEHYNSA